MTTRDFVVWLVLFAAILILGAIAAFHGARPDLGDILFFMPVEN